MFKAILKKLLPWLANLILPLLWELIQPLIQELIDGLLQNMVKSNQKQVTTLLHAIKNKEEIKIGEETIDIYSEENLNNKDHEIQ